MMDEAVAQAIDTIYTAALDRAHWPILLERLAKLFNSIFADTFQRTVDYRSFSGTAYGLDERDYQDEFLGIWVKRNVWGKRRPTRCAGDVLTTREMMPVASLLRSAMYQDYLRPRGLHEGLRLDIWASESWIEDLSFLRPWSSGAFTLTEKQMAHALLPHLHRAASVTHRIASAESLASASLAAFDGLRSAVLVLDRHTRLLHANPAAVAMLAVPDGLVLTASGLRAADANSTNRLTACIAAAAGATDQPARSGALLLPCPSGNPHLSVVAHPLLRTLASLGRDLPGTPAVLLMINASASCAGVRRQAMVTAYRLTRAETVLAADLLNGDDLRTIAAKRSRSLSTIRTQLAGLMAKTDTKRQAELVILLAKLQLD